LMSRLIPDGFLMIRQAAERLAVAMYAGQPDPDVVKKLRDEGEDGADGAAIADAIAELWKAVDQRKVQPFVVGPTGGVPLKLSAEMSKGIPVLRSPRGQDLCFLRPRNRHHKQFVEWFGPDLSTVSVVFREEEVTRLGRNLLAKRRRRMRPAGQKKTGRPPLELTETISKLIDERRWSSSQSIKALTTEVNRRGKWKKPVSEDTVARVLDKLHETTADRRFERVRRKRKPQT
jgi:hypothetical protein